MCETELLALTSVNLKSALYNSLDNFILVDKIGKGTFSTVYRARSMANGVLVALKKIPIFEMVDAKSRLDCMKEVKILQVNNLFYKN